MNREDFMKKYGLYQSDSANCYLSKWNNQFRLLRPVVNKSLPSTVCQNSSTAQIWLQSDACRFSKQGSCTCCDYFQGETDTDQVEAFKIALKKIQPNTDTIVLNTCGSVLDEAELKREVLSQIIELTRQTEVQTFVLETHITTINERILKYIHSIKGRLDIFFEIGIESLDDDRQRFILNKIPFQRNIRGTIDMIHRYGFKVTANVMTGFPFMERDAQICDGIRSIRKLLDYKADFIVLFPVNIKKYTLMYHLYKKKMYSPPDGRILLDILLALSEEELENINTAWYGEPRIEIPGYRQDDMITPYYCNVCYKPMMDLWLAYNCAESGAERRKILLKMNAEPCDCRKEHKAEYFDSGIDYVQLDTCYERLKCELGGL